MSTKVAGVTVSAKIKNERVTVFVRKTTIHSMEFWASSYPFDGDTIDKKNWVAKEMQLSEHKVVDLCEVTPAGWRIIEAAVKEVDIVLEFPTDLPDAA